MVSGISFRGGSLDSARDILNQPQRHARPQDQVATQPQTVDLPKKKGKAGKIILGTLATAAVVAGALFAGKNFKVFDKVVEWGAKDGANALQKYAGEGAKALNTAGEWIGKQGSAVVGWGRGLLAKVGIGGNTPAA